MLMLKIVQSLDKLNEGEWKSLSDRVLGPDIHPERRETFCFAREALRLALCEYDYKVEIPDLVLSGYHSLAKFPELTFSLSHTRKTGVALLGRTKDFHSLGVDVERSDRAVKDSLRDKICHPDDEAKLRNIELWVLKEAAFKCLSNSGLYSQQPLYTDLKVSGSSWQHSPSGIKGECELTLHDHLILGKALLRRS